MKIFFFAFLCIVLSVVYSPRKDPKIEEVYSLPFVGASEMEIVKKSKDKNENVYIDMVIGDVFNTTELFKELSNVEYEAVFKSLKGSLDETAVNIVPVNEHYIVLEITNLPKNYGVMKLELFPKVKDNLIPVDLPEQMDFYVHENKIDQTYSSNYNQNYVQYQITLLDKKVVEEETIIKESEANIELNKKLIKKLEVQKESEKDAEEKENLDLEIETYLNQSNDFRNNIEKATNRIAALQEKKEELKKQNGIV